MAFERFTKTKSRGYRPKVSIWSRGQIGFNQGFISRYNVEDYKFIVLFYDKEDKKIGFRFTKEDEEGCIKFSIKKTGMVVSARAFLDYYNIDYSETRKYDVSYDEGDDLYVINLSE